MSTYREVTEVPAGITFEVATRDQGQIVEVAYADGIRGKRNAWKRVIDQSLAEGNPGRVRYFRAA